MTARLGVLVSGNMLQAIIERLVNRTAGTLTVLVVAIFVSPKDAGKYSLAMLALTFVQAMGDYPIRQIGVAALSAPGGLQFLRRCSFWTALGGFTGMSAFLLLLLGLGVITDSDLLGLAPIALAPLPMGFGLVRLSLAQFSGGWKRISWAQSVGSITSLLVALPLVPVIGIGGAALQMLLLEIVFFFAVGRRWELDSPVPDAKQELTFRTVLISTSTSSVVGWTQGQSERVVVSAVGGTGVLGLYSLAASASRTIFEAMAMGQLNVFRSEMARASSASERAALLNRAVRRGLAIGICVQAAISTAGTAILYATLSPAWNGAIAVMPVLGATAVPVSVAWTASAFLIVTGQARRLLPWQVLGVVLSVGSGLVLAQSLLVGSLAVLSREFVAAIGRMALVAGSLSRSTLILVALSTCLSMTVGALTSLAAIAWH